MPPWTSNTQKMLPPAAASVAVTPSGSAFASSAWSELAASLAADSLWLNIVVFSPVASVDFEFDIGTGAAASEVVRATVCGIAGAQGLEFYTPNPVLAVPIPIDSFAAGSRVVVRMRKTGTSTTNWEVKLSILEKPIVGAVVTTTTVPKVVPSAAASARPASHATAWSNGSYVELVASHAANGAIAGACFQVPGETDYEIDFAQGAAASEVVFTTFRGGGGTAANTGAWVPLPNPRSGITSGSRTACRLRASAAGAATGWFKYGYYPTPL